MGLFCMFNWSIKFSLINRNASEPIFINLGGMKAAQ